MSGAPNPVVEAERDAEQARERMMMTVGALQQKLAPARLMSHAKDGARQKATALMDDGVTAAKARPATVAAIAVAFTAFLFRREILSLFRRRSAEERSADTDIDTTWEQSNER